MTTSAFYLPTQMNVGVMDILNFLDKKDNDSARPFDLKDNDGFQEFQDNKHVNSLERKESRIPVALRRLRPRTDRTSTQPQSENTQHRTNNDGKVEEWQATWNTTTNDKQSDEKNKIAPMDRRKPPIVQVGNQINSCNGNPPVRGMHGNLVTANGQHLMCPKCGRSCIMINRDGVYVAFSVGITPLVLLCLFMMCVFFGWLGLGYGVGPAVLRRLRLPNGERDRQRNWLGKWFAKEK